jgi:hypothetical protein
LGYTYTPVLNCVGVFLCMDFTDAVTERKKSQAWFHIDSEGF